MTDTLTTTAGAVRMWLAQFVSADPDVPGAGVTPIFAPDFDAAVKVAHRLIAAAAADEKSDLPPLVLDSLVSVPVPGLTDDAEPEEEHHHHAPPKPRRRHPKPEPAGVPAMQLGYL